MNQCEVIHVKVSEESSVCFFVLIRGIHLKGRAHCKDNGKYVGHHIVGVNGWGRVSKIKEEACWMWPVVSSSVEGGASEHLR